MASSNLIPEVLFNVQNRIGHLRAVSPVMYEFAIENEGAPCSVDDYVLVQAGSIAIFGRITNLESELEHGYSRNSGEDEVRTVGMITPSASIDTSSSSIFTGVVRTPKIGAEVYVTPASIVGAVLNPVAVESGESMKVVLNFASFTNTDSGNLYVSPEMVFGRHCAVLGTTGSGKSWSCASMIEECKKHSCKIVLLDPSGEYSSLRDGVRSVYLGDDLTPPPGTLEVALPYYDLKESDLFAIFRPMGETQSPKLHAAIKSLKLVRREPGVGVDGLVFKTNKSKQHFDSAYKEHYDYVENPYCDFEITKLTRQINNECVFPTRSDLEPFVWGDYNGMEQAGVVPLVNRIGQIVSSSELSCIFKPGDRPSLLGEIDSFLNDPDSQVLRISLQHLSYAFHTREIVANAVGRFLLEQARERRFSRQPLIVFVDEAHHFLDETLTEDTSDYPLDAFSLIAKEGRKYCLTVCLATQRPRDIPEGVLSQMGSFIVHRVINHNDRSVIERAASQADEATMSVLPMLSPGEAVMLGIEFAIPLHIKIKPPKDKPISSGPEYQQFWARGAL